MSDPTQLSDADLLAEIQSSQAQQQASQMSHTGNGGYDPANSAWEQQFGPTSGMSVPEKIAAGMGRGMIHTGRSIANMVGAVPDSVMNDEKVTDAPLMDTMSGKLGNLLGETAITAPLGAGALQGIGKLGAAGASLAANPIANAGIQGAMQGAATSDPGDRLGSALTGAVTGGGIGATQGLAGKLVNGLSRTPDAQRLIDAGISLTPGQMNPTGIFNNVESTAAHLPFGAGSMVEAARDVPMHEWQAAAIGRGAAPGAKITPSGNVSDMLQQAYDSYKPLYDQAKGFPATPKIMNTNGPDVPLSQAFAQATRAPGTSQQGQQAARSFLNNELTRAPINSSDDLLTIRSNIRQAARAAKLSTDTTAADKAAIFSLADKNVTDALNSQLPPEPLAALQKADSNYGNYKTVENAVAASKDNLAGLTPQKLSQSIYNQTPDGSYARGAGGDLRQLAQDGTSVFRPLLPPTGKTLAGSALLGGLTYAHPAIAGTAGAIAAPLVLTPGGRALAAGVTAPQQAAQRLIAGLKNNVPDSILRGAGQTALSGSTLALNPVTQQTVPQALAAALLLRHKPDSASEHEAL